MIVNLKLSFYLDSKDSSSTNKHSLRTVQMDDDSKRFLVSLQFLHYRSQFSFHYLYTHFPHIYYPAPQETIQHIGKFPNDIYLHQRDPLKRHGNRKTSQFN